MVLFVAIVVRSAPLCDQRTEDQRRT